MLSVELCNYLLPAGNMRIHYVDEESTFSTLFLFDIRLIVHYSFNSTGTIFMEAGIRFQSLLFSHLGTELMKTLMIDLPIDPRNWPDNSFWILHCTNVIYDSFLDFNYEFYRGIDSSELTLNPSTEAKLVNKSILISPSRLNQLGCEFFSRISLKIVKIVESGKRICAEKNIYLSSLPSLKLEKPDYKI